MRRRRLLGLTAAVIPLGGCATWRGNGGRTGTPAPVTADQSPDASIGGNSAAGPTPSDAGLTNESTDTLDPETPTAAPIAIDTPARGDCDSVDPPNPDPEAITGELAGHATPWSYPDKPTMTAGAVRSFVETYEATYRFNAVLAGRQDGVPDGISRLDTWLRGSTVRAVATGFLVVVYVTLNYGDDASEPGTGSPAPTGHQPTSATYYLTDRFCMRDGGYPALGTTDHPPRLHGGQVLECW